MTEKIEENETDDYAVGYGKPPKHTQFKKGQSGNRKGKAHGTKNLKADLRGVLDEELPLTMGGREVKLSARRAMLVALRNKALKGDVRAIGMLVNMLERLMPETLLDDGSLAVYCQFLTACSVNARTAPKHSVGDREGSAFCFARYRERND
jgi:hypothetical protein